ncbi:hypothetical protein ACSQ67_010647 [Phaseolus vulgaris]
MDSYHFVCDLQHKYFCRVLGNGVVNSNMVELSKNGKDNHHKCLVFGLLSIVLKLLRISDIVFEITRKEQSSSNESAKENNGCMSKGLGPKRHYGLRFSMV